MLRKRYRLNAKPAFPALVSNYKGQDSPLYVHCSELALLHQGNGSSIYWNALALNFLLANLDWDLENTLGYEYGLKEHMR